MNSLAKHIDHTLLKPTATTEQFKQLCEEAITHQFAAVCVPPFMVKKATEWVKDSAVNVCTVIGFPLGYNTISVKIFEALNAIQQGADEIDMVINSAAFKSKAFTYVEREITLITQAVHEKDKVLKVIVETAYLDKEELVAICEICARAQVDYVKTSTGFANPKQESGAKLEYVKLMKATLPEEIKIKASGGIKSAASSQELINAGVQRLGTSSGLEIIGVV